MSLASGNSLDAAIALGEARKHDDAEFDITAMIDLVFMMNIYFMVTALSAAMGEIALPTAERCVGADMEGAVIISIVQGSRGEPVVTLGEAGKGEYIRDSQWETAIPQAVREMLTRGKSTVVIKAEGMMRHEDVARVARFATETDGVTLYFGVLEKAGP